MKKISAVFNGLKFADSTLAYAIKLAESSKALLSGVFRLMKHIDAPLFIAHH